VIQLRQCIGDKVVGVENVVVATYSLVNVSDDKPKLLLKQTSIGAVGSTARDTRSAIVIAGS